MNTKIKRLLKKSKALIKQTIAISALFLLFFPSQMVKAEDDLDAEIRITEQKIQELKSQNKSLSSDIAIFDAQVYSIQLQINQSQRQIDLNNQKIQETNKRISEAETELIKQKEILNEYLRIMYIEGQISTVELIVVSDSFSDFVDRSEYLSTIQQTVKESAEKIALLKTELEVKKKDLEIKKANIEQLKAQQIEQRKSIDSQRYAKNILLSETKGQESKYKTYLDGLYDERRNRSLTSGESGGGGSDGGYPYANTSVYNRDGAWVCVPDKWNMCARQCTSYAAYKATSLGIIPASTIRSWAGRADGGNWFWLAQASGLTVSKTPRANSIVSFPQQYGMPYGHVAYVRSVNSDGTINVSEYNYWYKDKFNERDNVNPSKYGAYFIY